MTVARPGRTPEASTSGEPVDPFDVRGAAGAIGRLREFNVAGVLAAADVHVAQRLAALLGEADDAVILAAALAVRAPRIGHVYVDLATIRDTATVDADEPADLSTLAWPAAAGWLSDVAASPLVTAGEDDAAADARVTAGQHTAAPAVAPLRLVGSWLYLDRYWREERQVAADLRALGDAAPSGVRLDDLADGVARLFAGETDGHQALAAAAAVLRRLAIVAGGPGTGKTTTVARIVALLAEQAAAAGAPAPLIALAAPTGKAAAQLEEAVHAAAAELDVTPAVREQLLGLQASTLHRLLGWRPGSHSRFRHHRGQRLPHDVVIVDETSMVSLGLMGRLVEATRADARLVLVGDPGQLVSIEAGAVLGDVVGPAADGLRVSPAMREQLARVTGHPVRAADPPPGASVADGIVVLERVHRYGGAIAALATAIRRGDADAVMRVLAEAGEDVTWIPVDATAHDALGPVRDGAVAAGRAVFEAAAEGRAADALAALGAFRILCAHRRGPQGVAEWIARVEAWLTTRADGFSAEDRFYVGRPLLVTKNDYELQLYNGDTGVVVRRDADHVVCAFERRGATVTHSPARLGAVDTAYAMTIHKSQGSQFDTAAVLLPAADSRILTRELLYTAATRARTRLILAGTEETIRAAVDRPATRASGLRSRLWG